MISLLHAVGTCYVDVAVKINGPDIVVYGVNSVDNDMHCYVL